MIDIFRNLLTVFGVSPELASPMVSSVPANVAGIGNDIGTLEVGKLCDFVEFDPQSLELRSVVIAGCPIGNCAAH